MAQAIPCQAFTNFFHFTVSGEQIKWSPIGKKIWLSIHPRNFGNHDHRSTRLFTHLSRLNSK